VKVYIGVVESEIEYGECRDSIEKIIIRPGDIPPVFIRATKGYEARQQHFNNWLDQTDCEYMLLLDGDMIFPKDTLEKLRAHNLPYVSGAYLRRTYAPPVPVWFEDGSTFPYMPWVDKFEENKLYKIGASGWGCILIHRDVANAVKPLLKGEPFVIEDDMDVYPYDLKRIMGAISDIENGKIEAVKVLREEIRPLRFVKDMIGSDIRFPFFAKMAGFDLWLDTGVMCGHMLNYQLHPLDYINTPDNTVEKVKETMRTRWKSEAERLQNAIIEGNEKTSPDENTHKQAERIQVNSGLTADNQGGTA
jgi:hypothetical protein